MAKGETVARILAQVRAAAPDLTEGTLQKIASGIHADMGGERVYVARNASWGKALRLIDALAAGRPLAQAFVGAGISRATGFRILSRPWRR